MELSCENLRQLARLCRLELEESEIEKYRRDLIALEALAEPLLSVLSEQEHATGELGMTELRDDVIGDSLPWDAIRVIAPAQSGGYLCVPRTLEGGDT